MTKLLVVGVLLLLTGLAVAPAGAAPSLYGYTGLLLVPDADALNEKDFDVAYYALNVEEGADERIFCANVGVNEGTEVGFARIKPDRGDPETLLSGKYRIQPEDAHRPALAAGIFDATDEYDTTVYFVASKSLARNYRVSGREITSPRIHIGMGGGILSGLFVGATAVLGERLTVIGEYDTEDVNFGARLALTPEIRAHAGWINGLDDVALGASYNKLF
jgi:hypothetical protein